jgi:fructan beta-fructosidase
MAACYTQSLAVDQRYLHVPVKSDCPRLVVQLTHQGVLAREFSVELALSEDADWWAFYDLSPFLGETLELAVVDGELPPGAETWLAQAFRLSADLPAMPDLYHEPLRPQLHFTPRRGWNNDPNGMVYQDGEWHLYYQHNPFGVRWGNMHWGHAVSRDLLHWQELPEALYQRSLQDMAFSGGGLIDVNNTAGFQRGDQLPLVVTFTSTGRGECLAYSLDHGRTLVEWEGNPFLPHQGRDPKVIFYPATGRWVMIVYEELPDGERGYAFYDSPDLKHWQRQSFLPGWYECPEFFELPLDGDPARRRWVVYGSLWEKSPSACLTGDFDGRVFTPTGENPTAHCGPNFYAAQIFSNSPDGRLIMIGWLANAVYPGMPFSQGMSVPLELSLCSTPAGPRLCFYPVRELNNLRAQSSGAGRLSLSAANDLLARADSELLDVELLLSAQETFTLDVRGFPVSYQPEKREISFAGRSAVLPEGLETLELRVLVDRSVTEVFAGRGLAAFSAGTLFTNPAAPLRLEGPAQVERITVHRLKSIW